MTEEQARKILGETIRPNNSLSNVECYVDWWGCDTVTLDDHFTADQLEAIAWWMKNKKVKHA